MLIRFIVKNLFSFGEEKEFNMLPAPRFSRLGHHKYNVGKDSQLLKMAAIYGANGAGKSNLVKSIYLLEQMVLKEDIHLAINSNKYKFSTPNTAVHFGIEFYLNENTYMYFLEVDNNIVLHEELYKTHFGKTEPEIVFERSLNEEGQTKTRFNNAFEEDTESKVLKKVIEKSLIKKSKTIFKTLTELDNPFLEEAVEAFSWFKNCLIVIEPKSKPNIFAHHIDTNESYRTYANEIIKSFHTGIQSMDIEKKTIQDFFGEDNIQDMQEHLEKLDENKILNLELDTGERLELVMENETPMVKRLVLKHKGPKNKIANFYIGQESDGTIRLMDYIPAFRGMVTQQKVYIIDELERSIHPVLIKELVQKFADDPNTKGQLIFTTHESNLLDQNIFRQDEIWFAEKDHKGCTDLYPLSEFKEHHTKDIQKSYLNGRYNAIPFMGNLKDLNWHNHETEEQD